MGQYTEEIVHLLNHTIAPDDNSNTAEGVERDAIQQDELQDQERSDRDQQPIERPQRGKRLPAALQDYIVGKG